MNSTNDSQVVASPTSDGFSAVVPSVSGQEPPQSVPFDHNIWRIDQHGALTPVMEDPFPRNDGDFAGMMNGLGYSHREFGIEQEIILHECDDVEEKYRRWLYVLEVTPMSGRWFLILVPDFPCLLAAMEKVQPLLALSNSALLVDEFMRKAGTR